MDARTFNGKVMPSLNHCWAASVLNMSQNSRGIDLEDDKKGVELKFRVIYPFQNNGINWRVLEEQLQYNTDKKPAFWGLALYHLPKLAEKLTSKDIRILEKLVSHREIYLVDWKWMYQFESHVQQGKGEKGEWKNTLRFPSYRYLPKIESTWKVKKGLVHFTENVPENIFDIRGTRIK